MVINDGALEAPSRENFRKKILETCNIYTIISLPKFEFAPYTKEKTYILFLQKKQKDEIAETQIEIKSSGDREKTLQKFPIWHFILDYDGYANSDKRYKTKYHDDIPELEEKFERAVELSKYYISDRNRFETERVNFEREINEKEEQDGLWGMKCGFVEMNQVSDENFYNLLSEFYLRPVIRKKIDEKEFDANIATILDNFSSIESDIKEIETMIRRRSNES